MNSYTSIYLDLVRFAAAAAVFLTHATYDRFTADLPKSLGNFGTDAVTVFFVLSGFVIAYVAEHKEKTVEAYAISRLARLWSVVIPALVLTAAADYLGSRMDPATYSGPWFMSDQPIFRFMTNLFFVNELWFFSIRPFSNGPFWSVGYEFWYYVLFAAAFYFSGRTRSILLTAGTLLVGPKILLLLPVWVLGVLTYRISSRGSLGLKTGWFLFVGSIGLYILYQSFDMPERLLWRTAQVLGSDLIYKQLRNSGPFLSVYLIGSLVAANFLGFCAISTQVGFLLARAKRPIRFLAGKTFSLYLYHYPLLHFFAAFIQNDPKRLIDQALVFGGTVVTVFLLGSVTESKKDVLRHVLSNLLIRVRRLPTNP